MTFLDAGLIPLKERDWLRGVVAHQSNSYHRCQDNNSSSVIQSFRELGVASPWDLRAPRADLYSNPLDYHSLLFPHLLIGSQEN